MLVLVVGGTANRVLGVLGVLGVLANGRAPVEHGFAHGDLECPGTRRTGPMPVTH
ncbi:hypothetical protein ACGFW5_29035 [Streptomyces sp. NPDC048416]|uniref:hypothetical protein n=1 Tax=Streptomyces sp. NPDC048416 TaxID=3365546 RepID=UPI0037136041